MNTAAGNQEIECDDDDSDEYSRMVIRQKGIPAWVVQSKQVVTAIGQHRSVPAWHESLFYALRYHLNNLQRDDEILYSADKIQHMLGFSSFLQPTQATMNKLAPTEQLLSHIETVFRYPVFVYYSTDVSKQDARMGNRWAWSEWVKDADGKNEKDSKTLCFLYLANSGYYLLILDSDKFLGLSSNGLIGFASFRHWGQSPFFATLCKQTRHLCL